ncbi:MAG: energy-coupling factor transporter transmembrane protein EcfT [Bacteroidales bacterium]|nr:energy-coupling factor transporter transmembrane protein EcfT [Bacteroidales bacterium]
MGNKIPPYLLNPGVGRNGSVKLQGAKLSFLDKTILNAATAVKSIYLQEENATKENPVQKINPDVKLFSLIFLVVVISIINNLVAQIIVTAVILIFYIVSRIRVFEVYRKIFFLAFMFGFVVVFPASLNIITQGEIVFNLISLDKPLRFWIYYIPQDIGFTLNGFHVVFMVFLRVLNSVSLALLIIYTTSFPAFIKSFRIFRVPDTFLMIITLAYKYIIILSRTIEETYFALKSRLSGNIKNSNIRRLIGGRIYFIFKRSMIIYEGTYYAMVSRGYQGKVMIHSPKHFTVIDFITLIIVIAFGIGIILI